MTAILAVNQNDTIHIISDSYVGEETGLYFIEKQSKVKHLDSGTLFAYSGPFAHVGIVKHALLYWLSNTEEPSIEDLQFECSSYLREQGLPTEFEGSEFIFTYENELYSMCSSLSVFQSTRPYTAIGAGAELMLGMMDYACDIYGEIRHWEEDLLSGEMRRIMHLTSKRNAFVKAPFRVTRVD